MKIAKGMVMFKSKYAFRLLCGCMAILLISAIVFSNAYADTVLEKEAAIKSRLSSVRGSKDYSGYCGNCTADQLKSAGIFSTVYSPRNGKDFYDTYNGKNPSNGMSKTLFPGEGKGGTYTLEQICNLINTANTDGKMTYTVFCFKKGSQSDNGQAYGHVLLVHAIYNGKVFWGESFGTKARTASIKEFVNTYNKRTVNGKTCYLFDGAIAYDYVPYSSASTLEFRNVSYPKPYKVGSTGGYKLSGGMLVSDVELKTISTKIVDATGKIISGEKTYNISGKSYAISSLDTFSGDDNGVRFSFIKTAGNYYWILKATDSSGRALTLTMPFEAVSSGSTNTASKTLKYPGPDPDSLADKYPYYDRTAVSAVYVFNNNNETRVYPYEDTTLAKSYAKGDKIEIVATGTNKWGNTWYETTAGTYVWSGDVDLYFTILKTLDAYVKTTKTAEICTWPDDSTKVQTAAKDTQLHIIAQVKNTRGITGGNIWYQTDAGNYVWENQIEFISGSDPSPKGDTTVITVTREEKQRGNYIDDDRLPGDVNDDGEVDMEDAMLTAQFFVGIIDDNEINIFNADVNNDNEVDMEDVMLIAMAFVGMVTLE